MYNTFKDISKERDSLRKIMLIVVLSAIVAVVFMFFICLYYINNKEQKIYVLDQTNAYKLAKIQNIKDNRIYEVRDFLKNITNLTFAFAPDKNFNAENLNTANTFFRDGSLTNYIATLGNNGYFAELASKNLSQTIVSSPGSEKIKITAQTAISPYKVLVDFYVYVGAQYKHITYNINLVDTYRSDLNPHGFECSNFTVNAEIVQKLPD